MQSSGCPIVLYSMGRAIHNFFHLGGGEAMSLSEVENMATLAAVVHCRGVWEYVPPGNFRCSEAHSGAF